MLVKFPRCASGILSASRVLLVLALCSPGLSTAGPSLPSAGLIVDAPQAHAVVQPGERVPVRVTIAAGLEVSEVLVGAKLSTGVEWLVLKQPPFHGHIVMPEQLSGPIELVIAAKDAAGAFVAGASVPIDVVSESLPVEIYTINRSHRLGVESAKSTFSQRIIVRGVYAQGLERNISTHVTGTRYVTSDARVVRVDEDGVLHPLAPGLAFVRVEHRGLATFVRVDVDADEGSVVRLVEHTDAARIVASAPRPLSKEGHYEIEVSVENTSSLPFATPLHLVIEGLAPGVRVAGTRATSRIAAPGAAVVYVPVDEGDFLLPAATSDVRFTLVSYDGRPTLPTLRLYTGTDP